VVVLSLTAAGRPDYDNERLEHALSTSWRPDITHIFASSFDMKPPHDDVRHGVLRGPKPPRETNAHHILTGHFKRRTLDSDFYPSYSE